MGFDSTQDFSFLNSQWIYCLVLGYCHVAGSTSASVFLFVCFLQMLLDFLQALSIIHRKIYDVL